MSASRKSREMAADKYFESSIPRVEDHEALGESVGLFRTKKSPKTVKVGRDDFRVYEVAIRMGAHTSMAPIPADVHK